MINTKNVGPRRGHPHSSVRIFYKAYTPNGAVVAENHQMTKWFFEKPKHSSDKYSTK